MRKAEDFTRYWIERAFRGGAEAALERLAGTETRGMITPRQAGLPDEDRLAYEASGWVPVYRALRSLDLNKSDVLLEWGAGKGRVLVIARRFPFARILGLEASPMLADRARENLERVRGRRRCSNVEVVVADASRWAVPDDVTVVYMNCPFTGEIFKAAVDLLLESVTRRPREVRVVYNNPFEHNFLLSTGRFKPIDVFPAAWPAPRAWHRRRRRRVTGPGAMAWMNRRVIVIYELLGVGEDPASASRPAVTGPWSTYRDTAGMLPGDHRPIVAA